MIESLGHKERRYPVSSLCGSLGITPQGFYKHAVRSGEETVLFSSVVAYCRYVRRRENLPRAGCRELYELCRRQFGARFTVGRDRFYGMLRSAGLMLRRRRRRVRTTDSRHSNPVYPDLVNTSPRFVPSAPGQLVVCDITYVRCREGFAYLSLVTDAYSRYIAGYALTRDLSVEGPLAAMAMAEETYRAAGICIRGMIHHSDRGVQYTCARYVSRLLAAGVRPSMTQCGDPLDNALAERQNNTVKNGWMFNGGDLPLERVAGEAARAIYMYNHARPHQGLGMLTPAEMMGLGGANPVVSADGGQDNGDGKRS